MSRKKFSTKDYKALNSKGPAITYRPPGGGRAQVRIGTGIQKPPKPPHPHARTKRDEPSP